MALSQRGAAGVPCARLGNVRALMRRAARPFERGPGRACVRGVHAQGTGTATQGDQAAWRGLDALLVWSVYTAGSPKNHCR